MKSIFRYIRRWFYYRTDLLFVMFFGKREITKTKRLLIVRLDAIGDFTLWLYVSSCFRELYPDYLITLVCSESCAEIANEINDWDEVIALNVNRLIKNPWYRWRNLSLMNSKRYEVCIQPVCSRVFLVGDSIVRSSNARKRIGVKGDLSNITEWESNISNSWYTNLIKLPPELVNELDKNIQVSSLLADRKIYPTFPNLSKSIECYSVPSEPYIVIFPGASWDGRRWPVERFVGIVEWMLVTYNHNVVLCGSMSEKALSVRVEQLIKSKRLINMCGSTNLLHFIKLLKHCELLVSNETSSVHLASAIKAKSVCIVGGGHFNRFLPYAPSFGSYIPVSIYKKMDCFGCNWRCKYDVAEGAAVPCIEGVSLEEVKTAVKMILG